MAKLINTNRTTFISRRLQRNALDFISQCYSYMQKGYIYTSNSFLHNSETISNKKFGNLCVQMLTSNVRR